MDPVVVLDAAMSLAAARSALTLAPPGEMVVVRRRDPRATGAILWYPLSDDDRPRVMGPDLDPAMPLGVSLDLHEHGAAEVRQLTHPDVTAGRWTGLVVDGSRAVGWSTADTRTDRGPTRGIDFGPGPLPGAPGQGLGAGPQPVPKPWGTGLNFGPGEVPVPGAELPIPRANPPIPGADP